ncbi:uncharacterized protein LOC143624551 [Bidens hawaiensis]|uniref:uncharacterized protein LOC143624551 n=1 Tax=Bidens hawaiensis TaxID=980011 RepID=UPI00404958E5
MECNQQYGLARTLTYAEFPTKFVWKPDERVWDLHKRGFSIGRVHHVPPAFNEAYYLRSLLNKVKRPMCFEDIRTVDGEVCATYRDACYKRGLLDDDNEYIEAIKEASHTASGYYLRSLFATMLITYSLSRPDDVWEKCWHYLIDEILYKQQNDQKNPESQLKNLALLEIENFLLRNKCTLRCFPTMHFPDDDSILASTNSFMNEELAQILPVVQNGSRSDIVNASLSSSHIWTKFKVLRLTKNMRLTVGCQSSNLEDAIRFAEWLLELSEGKLGGDNDSNAIKVIPDYLLIRDSKDPHSDLIDFVYPALLERCNDISYFQERAILSPLNEVVE